MKHEGDIKADIEADIKDRGEPVSLMEPLLIDAGSRVRGRLTDLGVELAQKSAGFRRSLPESLVTSLADLVRAMNCYYSNLIEGHDTHPIDIERALKNDYSNDASKRDLQLEAKAHIAVQKWIDDGGLNGRALTSDASARSIVGSASRCPTICYGLKTQTQKNASALCPVNCAGETQK